MATRSVVPFSVSFCALLAAAVPGPQLKAAFVQPQSWARSAGGTTYQHWNAFDAYPTDGTPDVGDQNANGTAALTENTGGAFLTGSGNIYSPSVATTFTVIVPEADVPAPPHDVTVIAQFKTLGAELDPGSILLNGLPPIDACELSRAALGGFGGAQVERWFLFNIPYTGFGDGVAGAADLTLTFAAAGPSMSLDELSIDTAIRPMGFYAEPTPLPEPGAAGLLALAGVAALRRRRSRTHR